MLMVAVYRTPHGIMALISDEDLVGRSFFDQEKGLALLLPESIYGGKPASEEEALEAMKAASIIVVTGERAVDLAVRSGFLHPDSVVRIHGVPHAQVYKIRVA